MADIQRTPTTGAPFDVSISGAHPPLRRDLMELVNDKISFSIFVQALERMQKETENEDLSYYQISGIHGLPYTAFQGAGGAKGKAVNGYCTHNSSLFPTWHRPYLALFEQILCKHARDIAEETGVQEWKGAAENLRLPYWDWATKKMLPPVTTVTSLDIAQPDGTTKTLDENPLSAYRFKERTSIRTVGASQTERAPDFMDTEDTWNMTEEMRINLMDMFLKVHDWYGFSNDGRASGDAASHGNSVEAIHDVIHGDVGGFMGYIPIAAFDPIFWLHHCNIDRLFSFWQVLNPDVWVDASNTFGATTWTIARNETVTANTPLTPFYSPSKIASNGFWTSAETKLVSSFGYSYPELANLSSNDPRAELLAVISNLYGKEVAETQAAKVAALRANSTISPVLDAAATVASEAVASDSADSKVAPAAEAVAEISSNAAAFPHPTWWETRNPMIVLGDGPAALFSAVTKGTAPGAFFSGTAAAAEEAPSEPKATSDEGKDAEELPEERKKGPATSEEERATEPVVPHDTGLTDWFARISVEKYALETSFRVCIFLVPDGIDNSVISETDASTWSKSPHYVGQMCAFVNNTAVASCDNCVQQRENHLVIEGYVPLDRHLVKYSGLKTYGHEEVHPYLQKNMVWRVMKIDGSAVPIAEVPSLEVGVWSTTLVYNLYDWKSTVVPKWTEPHCHRGITAGQPGGCQHTGGGSYTPMLNVQA
ncbi:Di-copper centre-containing protein [Cystobasidium minutum MCA 4210]|uniref:Di-copper centre-containing protein n=1 Tax=Cystobasidium minutum MCA 4210 TaxID=1397322 RepID=UPI0034CEA4B5|eukprot:jgi/Rhomi1/211915/estExt_Genemark1.C_5_t10491